MQEKSTHPPDKFIRHPLARIIGPPGIGVVRHRVPPRLDGQRRGLLVVATALAVIGISALTANAAGPDGDPAPPTVAATAGIGEHPALAEREESDDRADRSERSADGEAEDGAPRAAEPQQSPEPEPTPTEVPAAAEEPAPEPAPAAQAAADWVHPMPGAATTSCFGYRWGVLHAGVDLASPHGTPIRAVGAGTVTSAGWVFGGYGISVVVDHGNGFYTHYAHASQANVSPGQNVSVGETIALEGSTGDSTGPHLHFEVHQGMWNQIEPAAWLRERGVDIGGC